MGRRTSASHRSRVRRARPSPSLPTTIATRPADRARRRDRARPRRRAPPRRTRVLQPSDRAADVGHPRVREDAAARRRGADRGGRHVRRPMDARHEHGGAGGLRGPRRGAEVLGIGDAVQDHHDRVVREGVVREVALARAAPPAPAFVRPRHHALVVVGPAGRAGAVDLDDGHRRRAGRIQRDARRPGVSLRAARHEHLARRGRRRRPRPRRAGRPRLGPSRRRPRRERQASAPSPGSPSPSGRVALTETRRPRCPRAGERVAHLVASRRDRGAVADHRHVAGGRASPAPATTATVRRKELHPGDAGERGIRLREVLADVAERRGAEQRVGDRVAHRVAVGVPGEAGLAVEPDAAEPQRPPARGWTSNPSPTRGPSVTARPRSGPAPGRGRAAW